MKLFIVFLFILFSFVSKAANADSIALTVNYSVINNGGSDENRLNLSQESIFYLAKTALEAKGWTVVNSIKEATNGIEENITVTVGQNLRGGSLGFAVALRMNGLIDGTIRGKKKVQRVAFKYDTALVTYGGGADFVIQNTRKDVEQAINNSIASTF